MMKKWMMFAIAVVAFLCIMKTVSMYGATVADKGNIIVYGSKTCPWCVKQEKYLKQKGIDYTFVNCPTETCPDFVSGFPTLMINGQVKSGYTEI